MKKLGKNILFTLIIWAGVFAAINFLSGFIAKNTYVHLEPVNKKNASQVEGYFQPNQCRNILFPGLKPYKVTTNSYGLRTAGAGVEEDWQAGGQNYKILCVGDSLTFGLFVDDEDTYPYRLQKIFKNKQLNAAVLNAGVGSSSIPDSLFYLKHKGLRLSPNLVIMTFYPNDINELDNEISTYEKLIKENVFSLFKTVKLMKFLRMFRLFEVNYKYSRYLSHIEDKKAKDILVNEKKGLEDTLYIDKFHEGRPVSHPYSAEFKDKWKKYFSFLEQTVDMLKQKNIDFLYVIYPDILTLYGRTQGYYQDILIEFLRAHNIRYIDLTPIFREKRNQYLELYNSPPRDFHLSGYGNQLLAEEIYNLLKNKRADVERK